MLDRLRLRLPLRLLLPALLVTLLPLAGPAAAQDDPPPAPELQVEVPSWLVLGPVAAPLPAFAGETGFEEDEAGQVEPADVLTDVQIPWPEVWPGAGDAAEDDNGLQQAHYSVYPENFGQGPFRWVVVQPDGTLWGIGAEFDLPSQGVHYFQFLLRH